MTSLPKLINKTKAIKVKDLFYILIRHADSMFIQKNQQEWPHLSSFKEAPNSGLTWLQAHFVFLPLQARSGDGFLPKPVPEVLSTSHHFLYLVCTFMNSSLIKLSSTRSC